MSGFYQTLDYEALMVSLIAQGSHFVEIGKYGTTLNEAKELFLQKLKAHDINPIKITHRGKGILITLPKDNAKNTALLNEVANVAQLANDPPTSYELVEEKVKEGEYKKTKFYHD
jgi:hypothetical protein